MTKETNFVAHFFDKGRSDKLYIVSISCGADNKYSVWGMWGRRKAITLSGERKGTFPTYDEALCYAKKLFNEKLNKGYMDIESPMYYVGLVTKSTPIVAKYLATPLPDNSKSGVYAKDYNPKVDILAESVPTDNKKNKSITKLRKEKNKSTTKPLEEEEEEFVVMCLKNTGHEDHFDEGFEYVASETRPKNKEFILVYDKEGTQVNMLRIRFKKVVSPK